MDDFGFIYMIGDWIGDVRKNDEWCNVNDDVGYDGLCGFEFEKLEFCVIC